MNTFKRSICAVLIAKGFALKIKFGARNGVYYFSPYAQCLISNLCEIVEADKRNVPVFYARRWIYHCRVVVPHIAKMTVLQPQHLLGKKFLIQTYRISVFVNHKIINRFDAGRIEPAYCADDYRRGLVRNHIHNVICRVPRKINKDINFVIDYFLCRNLRRIK